MNNVPASLGWDGYSIDRNRDGTVTFRFWVRIHELDRATGNFVKSVDKIVYFYN